MTAVFTVVKISPSPPDLTSDVQSQSPSLSLSLPDASATATTSHKNRCLASLLCYWILLPETRRLNTGDCFRKEFLWLLRRYNRHCPEISTQHVTSSPLRIKTHFRCELSLLSAPGWRSFFSFLTDADLILMTCCPQLPTRKVLRFSTESPYRPAAIWRRTDGKWQELLNKTVNLILSSHNNHHPNSSP